MATFVKLTNADSPQSLLVNLDLVRTVTREPAIHIGQRERAPERTVLWYCGFGEYDESISVVETPDTILAAIVAKGGDS